MNQEPNGQGCVKEAQETNQLEDIDRNATPQALGGDRVAVRFCHPVSIPSKRNRQKMSARFRRLHREAYLIRRGNDIGKELSAPNQRAQRVSGRASGGNDDK